MKVLKFGGTSVGTVESLMNVKAIMQGLNDSAVIVVSALGGLTDKLIAIAGKAHDGDDSYRDDMLAVVDRHHAIIDAVVPKGRRDSVRTAVDRLLDELSQIYDGVKLIGFLPEKTLAQIVSFGERMSSVIVSNMLDGVRHVDSLEMIKTERWFNKNIADTKLTAELIRRNLADLDGQLVVVGGFISRDRESGEITNLGRGGSDYTAALIAAALDAELLEIWTDVSGFMTADPRIIATAKVRDHMTFVESMELCSYGAKVIYPPTIYPVFHKNIPIKILNTFAPEDPGTLIDDNSDDSGCAIRGISAIKNIVLVTITGPTTQNVAEINSRTYNAMTKNGVSVLMVSQPTDESGFSFAVCGNEADKAVKSLEGEFSPEISGEGLVAITTRYDLAALAVVGEHVNDDPGLSARIVNTLQRDGIDVLARNDGSSPTTICMVVPEMAVNRALKLIHDSFVE